MPFCTCPVYSRVLLLSFPCFGLFINLLFIDKKKNDWNRPDAGLSQIECYPLSKTCETESEAFPPGSPSDYSIRGGQSSVSGFHQRGKVS